MLFSKSKLLYLFLFLLSNIMMAQEIYFSVPSGFYADDIELEMTSNSSGDIRYTLDGTDPTFESPIYNQPITVEDRNAESNSISNIPTNPATTYFKYVWKVPSGNIPKMRIVKATLFNNSIPISKVFYQEYFIDAPLSDIEMPIFSIIADSVGLFGYEEGIYVPGKDYDDDPDTWQPGNYYERGSDWERVAQVSFYENKNLVVRQKVIMDMHGGGSRIMPCKSIRLAAKSSLGNEYFEFPFFKNKNWTKYKRILLRNSGQDFYRSLFADVLLQSLLKNQNVEYQASRQVVVFVNGAYWGIHNLREKYDKYYFENYHDGDLEDIDYMEIAMEYIAKEGSTQDYENMNEALLNLDLSIDENYQTIASQIDIDNYIDYHISKIYGGGTDWTGNNERIWRTHNQGSRWRWVGNDYDDIFQELEKDSYQHATRTDWEQWPNPEWATRLFRQLMTNRNFAIQYKNSLRFHLDNTYSSANVIAAIDSLTQIYRPEMPRHIQRWNYPDSLEKWEATILDFKDFAMQRPDFIWENFQQYFPSIYENPDEIKLFPNPTKDFIFIDLPEWWAPNINFQIFDTSGKLMQDGYLSKSAQNKISVEHLPKGLFFISIYDKSHFESHRFIVIRE